MSVLSKENVIKDTVNQFVEYAEEILDSYDYERPVDVTINKEDIECIKGLLDLYQREKEKNKELEDKCRIRKEIYDRDIKALNGKWKDKIKSKAIEYENNNEGYDCTTADYKQSQNIGKYLAYIELLEERN